MMSEMVKVISILASRFRGFGEEPFAFRIRGVGLRVERLGFELRLKLWDECPVTR